MKKLHAQFKIAALLALAGAAVFVTSRQAFAAEAAGNTRTSTSPAASTVKVAAATSVAKSNSPKGAKPAEAKQPPKLEALRDVVANCEDALKDSPVLLVWLIDTTTSNEDARQIVFGELEPAYARMEEAADQLHTLHSVVYGFGDQMALETPEPLADGELVAEAMQDLPSDESGKEHTFAALAEVLKKYGKPDPAKPQFVIVIVVTNEVGDDAAMADKLVPQYRNAAVPVYVLGAPSPFGVAESLGAVVEVENWEYVRQGPESRGVELMKLDSLDVNFDAQLIESGFGPFALSWIALESGGKFIPLSFDHAKQSRFRPPERIARFKPEVMARYVPDYLSAAQYKALIDSNPARGSLVKACQQPGMSLRKELKMEFRAGDAAGLKRDLDMAQRSVARLTPQLKEFYDVIAAGEKGRPQLDEPRWQAAFDLAMGRVLAERARCEGYNGMLAALKSKSDFTKPGSTTWVLKTANKSIDSASQKLISRGQMYLERVVHDHPGTPWALLAERELKIPLGWEWTER